MVEIFNDISTDPFFDTYIETLEILSELGIEFSFKQRIPIFRVYTHLDELVNADPYVVNYAKALLEELREFMARGMEPEHKNGRYV